MLKRPCGGSFHRGWVVLLLAVCSLTACQIRPQSGVLPETVAGLAAPSARVEMSVRVSRQPGPRGAIWVTPTGEEPVGVDAVLNTIGDGQVTTATQRVEVGVEGVATITFDAVPVRTALAQLTFSNGTVDGASSFHAAADLVAGSNRIRVVDVGSNTAESLAAHLVHHVMVTPSMVEVTPTHIGPRIAAVVAAVDLGTTGPRQAAIEELARQVAAHGFGTGAGTGTGTGTGAGTGTGSGTGANTGTGTGGGQSIATAAGLIVPPGYASVAFPAQQAVVQVPAFAEGAAIDVVLVNTTNATVTGVVAVSAPGGSLRAALPGDAATALKGPGTALRGPTPAQAFQARLRLAEPQLRRRTRPGSGKPEAVKDAPAIGSTEQFTITPESRSDGVSENYSMVAVLRATAVVGSPQRYVRFYLDQADTFDSAAEATLNGLAQYFAAQYPLVTRIFGEDAPANAFAQVPSADIYCLYSSKIKAMGFFWAGDLIPDTPNGHLKKLIYMNWSTEHSVADQQSTLIHEYQHLVNYYQRFKANPEIGESSEEAFLNEALSAYAEFLTGLTLSAGNRIAASQISSYLENANKVSLSSWVGGDDDYGKAYLFGNWLAVNYGNGGSVVGLVASPRVGFDGVAAFCGLANFGEVLQRFALAMHINETAGGMYGIPGVDVNGNYTYGQESVALGGPARLTTDAVPYTSPTVAVAPIAVGGVRVRGGNGGSVTLTLPVPALTCFQLMK